MELTLDINLIDSDVKSIIDAVITKKKRKKTQTYVTEVRKLTYDEIKASVDLLAFTCNDCGIMLYSYPKRWRTEKICYKCHTIRYRSLCTIIDEYLAEKGMVSCKFCGKIRNNPSDFHLDHVNMFTKEASIYDMISYGEDIERIKLEIDKCQLLCISCHTIVTHFEHKYGFIRAKRTKNRIHIEDSAKIYNEFMGEIYDFIRGLHGK